MPRGYTQRPEPPFLRVAVTEQKIQIPIYHCDAILTVLVHNVQNHIVRKIATRAGVFEIPKQYCKHRAFDSFRKLEAFYREHQADLEIYDEYRRPYSWEEYMETVFTHSNYSPEPMKWVYEVNPLSLDKQLHLRTAGCSEEEAELYSPFNHVEYEKTLQKARQKFGVYEREYGDIKYWNDPDYLFDWTEGEFM